MRHWTKLVPVAACIVVVGTAFGGETTRLLHSSVHLRLQGRIVDHTFNHGVDKRIMSRSLGCKRDLYVYLPPNFNRNCQYPLMVYLHGVLSDEKQGLTELVRPLDRAISRGELPPMIVAIPDGSFDGNPCPLDPGSFFVNGPRGDYGDWIMKDVWYFMNSKYPIKPDAKAHILVGASMGGFGAYNIAIKRPDLFGIVIGIMPALNVRWTDLCGNYFAPFDPYNWGWRNQAHNPNEVIGDFGLVKVKVKDFIYPVFGCGFEAMVLASCENPIELVDRCKLRNGELDMFVGYTPCDEFNIGAQVESFLYYTKSRGIHVDAHCEPLGNHDEKTAMRIAPHAMKWLAQRLKHHGIGADCCNACDTCGTGGNGPCGAAPKAATGLLAPKAPCDSGCGAAPKAAPIRTEARSRLQEMLKRPEKPVEECGGCPR